MKSWSISLFYRMKITKLYRKRKIAYGSFFILTKESTLLKAAVKRFLKSKNIVHKNEAGKAKTQSSSRDL